MMSPESEKDAQARWIIKQEPPVCICAPTNPKHREGWHCVTPEALKAFMAGVSEPLRHFQTASDHKRAAWMWLQFSQDPEAKRLSGRDKPTGLDTWDDETGMSAIERMMFE